MGSDCKKTDYIRIFNVKQEMENTGDKALYY